MLTTERTRPAYQLRSIVRSTPFIVMPVGNPGHYVIMAQPGDFRVKRANLLAANTKIGDGVKELIDSYLKDTAEFSSMLEERTTGEVAYDKEVVTALRRGFSIKKALDLAGKKYPDDALQWDDETIDDIKAHYEYLMNHEDILAKLKWLTRRSN